MRWTVACLALALIGCSTAAPSAALSASAPASSLAIEMVSGHYRVKIGAAALSLARTADVDLEAATRTALAHIDELVPGPTADISIDVDPSIAIPDVGVGGFTDPRSGAVRIGFAVHPIAGLPIAVRDWLPGALAHELHHARRIRAGPGYGMAVGEAIVTEGLAAAFEREAFPAAPISPWSMAIDRAAQARVWPLVVAAWSTPDTATEHQRWFFGGTADIPRWSGYTLGYEVVAAYLRTHPGITPSALISTTASHIRETSGYSP
jgi:predicted Zn-dependent protease DUF2268